LREFFNKRLDNEAILINLNILRVRFGEDINYFDDAIQHAHRSLGITEEHVTRFLIILRSVMNDEGVQDEDVQLIISRICSFRHLIVQDTNESTTQAIL
jgi:hypothetical protein